MLLVTPNNFVNTLEIIVTSMRPNSVFNSKKVKINWIISLIKMSLNLICFLLLLARNAKKKTAIGPKMKVTKPPSEMLCYIGFSF